MENKILKALKTKVESLNLFIHPTTTSKKQFETNIKHEYLSEHLGLGI